MKVLVTGSQGYIGSVMVPMLLEAGHDGQSASTAIFTSAAPSRRAAPSSTCRPSARTSATSNARDLEGFDAVIHLAALSNDPLGNLNPEHHLRRSIIAPACAWPSWPRKPACQRFLFASSCSNYGQAGEEHDRRDRRAQPGHRLRRVEGAVRARHLASSPTTASARPILRPATAYGLSPRLRFDIVLNNLVAWAVTTGQIFLKSDGIAVAPDRAHRGHFARVHRRASRRRARRSSTRPSMSARRPTTTASARSPRSSPRSCRAAGWSSPTMPVRTSAPIG